MPLLEVLTLHLKKNNQPKPLRYSKFHSYFKVIITSCPRKGTVSTDLFLNMKIKTVE